MGGQDTLKSVRRAHEAVVIDAIARAGPLPRLDLIEQTGLSRTTLLAVVTELVARGVLLEGKADSAPRRGRPTQLLRLNPRGGLWMAVEVAPTRLRVGFANAAHEVITTDERPIALNATRATRMRAVDRLVEQTVTQEGIALTALRGAAVAGVGVDPSGHVSHGPEIADPDAVAVRRHVAKRFGVPTLLNDSTRLAAFAEATWGVARGCNDVLFVRLSHSVAAGIIANGQPVNGAMGRSGAIGHVVVTPGGHPCRCGQSGCLETEIGVDGLLRDLTAAGLAVKTPTDLLDLLEAGDRTARAVVRRAAVLLADVLVPVLAALNPEVLVLGGVLARAEQDVLEVVREQVASRTVPEFAEKVKVVAGRPLHGFEAVSGGLAVLLTNDRRLESVQDRIRNRNAWPVLPEPVAGPTDDQIDRRAGVSI